MAPRVFPPRPVHSGVSTEIVLGFEDSRPSCFVTRGGIRVAEAWFMRTLLTLGLLLATAVPAVAHADESGAEPKSTETTESTKTPATPAPHEAAAASKPVAAIPELPAAPAEPRRETWYGAQILLVDAAAVGLLVASVTVGSGRPGLGEGLAVASAGTYLLGGPIVHLAHGRADVAAGSLGLRVAVPILTAVAGMAIEQHSCSPGLLWCGAAGLVLGGAVGAVGAVAIDSAALAWAPRTHLVAAPMVGGGRLGVNLGGAF